MTDCGNSDKDPADDYITTHLLNCARCGGEHPIITFKLMAIPITEMDSQFTWTHWALCPNSCDPILFRNLLQDETHE